MKTLVTKVANFWGVFRRLTLGRKPSELAAKGFRLLRRDGVAGLRQLYREHSVISYNDWIERYDALTQQDRHQIAQHLDTFIFRPLVSVLMPVYNPPPKFLEKAITSVRQQLYPHWELCIVDNASTDPGVRIVLTRAEAMDKRVRVSYRQKSGYISAAGNTALGMACGDFIALLDHDDELSEHALYLVASALNEDPHLDLLYSDEDKIDTAGRHVEPFFKPDWNPDLFMALNLLSHLGVFRSALVRSAGGFREGFEGSQDWDLALRISEMIPAAHIHHIPYVLYHQHILAGSTATNGEADDADITAVREHLARTGRKATVSRAVASSLRVRHDLPAPPPLVSIIIPTRNGLELLRHCIDSIRQRTAYAPYEILVEDNQSDDPEMLAYLDELVVAGSARVLHYDAPFNYSAINNHAARAARGTMLCLLNNDIEVIGADWLGEMISQAVRPEIGAVGAMLYYPDDTIQHAGTIVGMSGCADHLYAGAPRGVTGMSGRARLVQNLSAVTAACLVIRKETYFAVDGLDEQNLAVAFNDVDFCLRVMERGYRNLWTPFAELYHHESASRGPEDTPAKRKRVRAEIDYMRTRWMRFIDNDPAFNPNLSLVDKWPRQGANPRRVRPWSTTSQQ